MTVHLLKLAVGAPSFDAMRAFAAQQGQAAFERGQRPHVRITTKMAPKRAAEVEAGGSLYWVIKGAVQARQRVLSIEPGVERTGRAAILLDPTVVAVRPRPCRPFQGWRYLSLADAPADFVIGDEDAAMPAAMRRDLMELCLI